MKLFTVQQSLSCDYLLYSRVYHATKRCLFVVLPTKVEGLFRMISPTHLILVANMCFFPIIESPTPPQTPTPQHNTDRSTLTTKIITDRILGAHVQYRVSQGDVGQQVGASIGASNSVQGRLQVLEGVRRRHPIAAHDVIAATVVGLMEEGI